MKYFDWSNTINERELIETVEILSNGGIVIFPTETLFALVGNAFDKSVINKIYKIKKRPINKPFSVFVKNINDINKVAIIKNSIENKIIEEFMPGSITIILNKKAIISNLITANLDTVGIRIPSNKIALKILDKLNFPLVSTSANISNEHNINNIDELINTFKDDVDIIINGKINDKMLPSTVLTVVDNEVVILREGCFNKSEILNKIN